MAETQINPFPSMGLAYDIAINSYEVMIKRLDSVDGRLQTMLALFATVTAAIPAIAGNRGLVFNSPWFYAAISAMALATIITAIARLMGEVNVLDPSKLSDEVLRQSEWEFKNQVILHAGPAFNANYDLVYRKWVLAVVVTFLFFLGAGCMTVWVVKTPRLSRPYSGSYQDSRKAEPFPHRKVSASSVLALGEFRMEGRRVEKA